MNIRRLDDQNLVVVLRSGEEIMETLARVASEGDLGGASVSGIGAFDRCVLGFYHRDRQDYERITIDEDVEVVSLTGNLTRFEGGPRVHLHAAVSTPDGTTRGGHLFEGRVGATLELFLALSPVPIERHHDEGVGLPLISP